MEADLQDAAATGDVLREAKAGALLDVLGVEGEEGRAVRSVGTLHLTLGVMCLRDGEGGEKQGKGKGEGGRGDAGNADGKSVDHAIALLRSLDVAKMMHSITERSQDEA